MQISLHDEHSGPHQPYIDCIWEVGDKNGVRERYEFRCDARKECCENVCCTPQAEILARFWMFLFVGLTLVVLLAHFVRPRYRRLTVTPALEPTNPIVRNP